MKAFRFQFFQALPVLTEWASSQFDKRKANLVCTKSAWTVEHHLLFQSISAMKLFCFA
jgi:hypothetical protein